MVILFVVRAGELVGFYVDGTGNTDGMIALPAADTQLQPDRGPAAGPPVLRVRDARADTADRSG